MRGPNKPIQTEEEMIQSITEQKRDNRIYKVQADEHRSDQLSSMIHRSSEQLEEAYRHKVRLSDTDAVKEQTMKYLKACEKVGAFPSIIGLSRALGYTRQAIYAEINRRKNPDTADWLEMCRDTFSDILNESALTNNCNSVVSIFLGKALYDLRESVEIVARPIEQEHTASIEELKKRYMALPCEEGNTEKEDQNG